MIFRYLFLAILATCSLASVSWGEEKEIFHSPMVHHLMLEENTPNVTQISISLKPHARTYVYRRYDWGNGKIEERYEEVMSEKEAHKLSKATGVELKLKPMSLPGEVHILHETEPMSAKDIRRLNKIVGGELINGDQILTLPFAMTPKEARAVAAKLAQHPDVKYAEPNSLAAFGFYSSNDVLN